MWRETQRKVFSGKITNTDVDEINGDQLYHVVYEDGDEEDLTHRECRFRYRYNLHIKIENQEINKWEIGDE